MPVRRFVITDTTISGQGYKPRRLTPAERAALLSAIRKLDLRYSHARIRSRARARTAYDAQESIYSFRGFPRAVPGCTYNLGAVGAVRIVERLLDSLKTA